MEEQSHPQDSGASQSTPAGSFDPPIDKEEPSSLLASTAETNSVDSSRNASEITWDSNSDRENPVNWSTRRKITAILLVSAIDFSTRFASDVSAPAITQIMRYFHNDSETLAGFVVSIFVLGNALGPIVFAPSSEIWGRRLVLQVSNVMFIAAMVGCALADSLWLLFLLRFLAGCTGAAPLAIGGGTVADLIPREGRGRYLAVFATGAQIAPIVGPIVGAQLTGSLSWRWVFWVGAIMHGAITLMCFLLLRETYAPAILRARAKRLLGTSECDGVGIRATAAESRLQVFHRALTRPAKILIKSPIVLYLSLFQACVFGYRYLMYTTIPLVYTTLYSFSVPLTGLAYIGSGIGSTVALYIITKMSDHKVKTGKEKLAGRQPPPEIRLLPMIWTSPLTGIGLLWYGWAAQERVHWVVPMIGTAVLAAGIVGASLPGNLYIIDAYTEFAASGLAASFFLRSIFGGLVPLAGTPLYDSIGVGWACTSLALIAFVFCIFPPLLYKKGERLRIKYPVKF